MAVPHRRISDSFFPIAQEDLEQFLKDIDCNDLVKRLREDGLSTCISIPAGETFTTVCEKMRQVAFSQKVRDQIMKHLTEKVESVIIANRMSLALCWLGILIDEARTNENLTRKAKLDEFLKQFFEHVDKLKTVIENDPETVVFATSLKMAKEDVPSAATALTFFSQIRELYNSGNERDDNIPLDYNVDESVWVQLLLKCGETTGTDLYPFSDMLEMSTVHVKHMILQKQITLMKECRINMEMPRHSDLTDSSGADSLPKTFYSKDHLIAKSVTQMELPTVQFQPGDHVYLFQKINYPWKLWNVNNVNRNILEIFDGSFKETCSTDQVALFKSAAQEGLWFPVETVVVAWLNDKISSAPFTYTEHYYLGIVIETPCVWNRFRYLIFFEKGDIRYVRPDFVCRRATQGTDYYKTMEHLNDAIGFLKDYFSKYPRRPFVMADVGQTLSCDFYGIQLEVVVEEIDCSLLKVRACSRSDKVDWIHRGSRRFELINHFLITDLHETGGQVSQPIRPHRINSSACVEVASWQVNGPVNKDGEMLPNDDQFCRVRNINRKHKPVAKKSSISGLVMRGGRRKRATSPPPMKRKEELQGSLIPEEFSERRGGRPSTQSQYSVHICTKNCLGEESNVFSQSLNPLKNRNLLSIPLHCGWARLPSSQNQSSVIYYAPCGKPLSSLLEVENFISLETKSRLTIEMFAFDRNVDVTKTFRTSPPIQVFLEDMSNGVEIHQSIRLANKFGTDMYDAFQYTNTSEMSPQIISKGYDPDYLVGCDCIDGCRDSNRCFCRQLTNTSASKQTGYNFRRLEHKVPTGIYECNSRCKCSCNADACLNRVVQREMRVRLQVFKTESKGWGVQALDDLPQGQFVCTYSGEILTSKEADMVGNEKGDEYLYDLDFLESAIRHKQHPELSDSASEASSEDSGNMDVVTQGSHQQAYSACLVRLYHGTKEHYAYVMDAKRKGNVSRFFNHSCDPNLFVQSVFIETHDLRLPVIAFFTSRRVRAGEELTWDYSYDPGSVPGRKIDCKCGAAICRNRLL